MAGKHKDLIIIDSLKVAGKLRQGDKITFNYGQVELAVKSFVSKEAFIERESQDFEETKIQISNSHEPKQDIVKKKISYAHELRKATTEDDFAETKLSKKINILEQKSWEIPQAFAKDKLREDNDTREEKIRQQMDRQALKQHSTEQKIPDMQPSLSHDMRPSKRTNATEGQGSEVTDA